MNGVTGGRKCCDFVIFLYIMLKALITASCSLSLALGIETRLYHKGVPLWLNGINVAWANAPGFCVDIEYLDPTCTSAACTADQVCFEAMVADVHNHGGNSRRFWLHADGGPVPVQNGDYTSRFVGPISARQINSVKYV